MMKKVFIQKARKILATMFIMVVVCLSMTGCRGPQYTEEEAKEVVDKGTALMEEWISKNCPDGKLLEIDHWDFIYPSGPWYLTDFVSGKINDGTRDRGFSANIVTGFVTLQADDEVMEEFKDCCRKLLLESLELDPDTEIYENSFYANITYGPVCEGKTDSWANSSFEFLGLPGEFVLQNGDVSEFVNNPDRGVRITIKGWMRSLPDDFAIGDYTYEDIMERQDKYNIRYDNFLLENSNETLLVSSHYKYEKWQYEDFKGRTVYNRCVLREAEIGRDGKIVQKEYTPSPKKSVKIKKTDTGYVFDIDRSKELAFILYVPDGDEMLKHDLIEKASSQGMRDQRLKWKKTDHGWTLTNERGNEITFFETTELVISG